MHTPDRCSTAVVIICQAKAVLTCSISCGKHDGKQLVAAILPVATSPIHCATPTHSTTSCCRHRVQQVAESHTMLLTLLLKVDARARHQLLCKDNHITQCAAFYVTMNVTLNKK